MENNLLYCYKNWLNKKEGSLVNRILKIPIAALILLVLLLAVLVALLVFSGSLMNGKKQNIIVTGVLICAYVILCFIVSIYTEKYQIKNSKSDLESYREYCIEMKGEVILGNKISLNLIPDLIKRLNAMSDRIEEKIKQKNGYFNRFMEMLLIPIAALILGALLDKEIDKTEVLKFGLSGFFIILFIYGFILFVSFLFDTVMRVPQNDYRRFATDLQSIIDFEKCDKALDNREETIPVTVGTRINGEDKPNDSETII